MDSIPGLGRSPGGGNGNPLQYPCLENPMDRGAWQDIVHGVAKNPIRLSTQEQFKGQTLPGPLQIPFHLCHKPEPLLSSSGKNVVSSTHIQHKNWKKLVQ